MKLHNLVALSLLACSCSPGPTPESPDPLNGPSRTPSVSLAAPQSAYVALTNLLGVVEEMNEGESDIEVRSIHSIYDHGNPSRPDSVRIQLDLTSFGKSEVTATHHFEALLGAFESESWCSKALYRSLSALPGSRVHGVYSDGLEVHVAGASEKLAADSIPQDPLYLFTFHAASREVLLGQIDIQTPKPITPYRGVSDTAYVIRPSVRDRSASLLQVFKYCELIEGEGMTVTRIHLDPAKKSDAPADRISEQRKWELTVTIRKLEP